MGMRDNRSAPLSPVSHTKQTFLALDTVRPANPELLAAFAI